MCGMHCFLHVSESQIEDLRLSPPQTAPASQSAKRKASCRSGQGERAYSMWCWETLAEFKAVFLSLYRVLYVWYSSHLVAVFIIGSCILQGDGRAESRSRPFSPDWLQLWLERPIISALRELRKVSRNWPIKKSLFLYHNFTKFGPGFCLQFPWDAIKDGGEL